MLYGKSRNKIVRNNIELWSNKSRWRRMAKCAASLGHSILPNTVYSTIIIHVVLFIEILL